VLGPPVVEDGGVQIAGPMRPVFVEPPAVATTPALAHWGKLCRILAPSGEHLLWFAL